MSEQVTYQMPKKDRIVIGAFLPISHYDEAHVKDLADAGVDFAANCAELIRSRYGELPTSPDERRKLYAALSRYGYSSSEINSAMEMLK
jgi:SOS response regulatory protein OraA/RecX